MDVLPEPVAVTVPFSSTVAIEVSSLVYDIFSTSAFSGKTVTVSVRLSPISISAEVGSTDMDSISTGSSTSVVSPPGTSGPGFSVLFFSQDIVDNETAMNAIAMINNDFFISK